MKHLKSYNESLRDKMTPVSDEKIMEIIGDLGFDLYGVDLEEKGNFSQDLTDIYASKDQDIYFKLGQIRTLGDLVIFYPNLIIRDRSIVPMYQNLDNPRTLNTDEKTNVILQLNQDKKFGSFLDQPETYLDIAKKFIKRH